MKQDLYEEVELTIEEHKKVMQQWEEVFRAEAAGIKPVEKDIYTVVEETIEEHKRVMRKWDRLFIQEEGKYYVMLSEQAA